MLVDAASETGGQCAAYYADKAVYDMPGFDNILAGEVVRRLTAQTNPAPSALRLGSRVLAIARTPLGGFISTLESGEAVTSRVVVLATGGVLAGAPTIEVGQGIESGQRWAVGAANMMTGELGVFAIGDAAIYAGKLPLLISAFHEAAMMTQAVRKLVEPARGAGGGLRQKSTRSAAST